ncbi:hypothetical protein CRX72_22710 [Pantoea sp. BRM17]|nr:hypothetical protein CRX72_22710 [Pantoea sp. BRM17]
MKTLLIKDSSLGLASAHLAIERLRAAAAQAGLELVSTAAEAEHGSTHLANGWQNRRSVRLSAPSVPVTPWSAA